MATDVKDLEELGSLTHRLREIVDTYGDVAEFKKALDEIQSRMDKIEAGAQKSPLGSEQDEKAARKKTAEAFLAMARKGERMPRELKTELKVADAPEAIDYKALSLSDDTLGGYFAMPEMVTDELIKNLVLISRFRDLARVRTTSYNSVKLNVRTSATAAQWTGETTTRSASTNPAFGQKDIPTHEMYGLMLLSRQLIEDSAFDLESEMRQEFAEQFAKLEGAAFLGGDGNAKPFGLLTDPTVLANQVTSAGGATLTSADPILTLLGDLATEYATAPSARLIFNRKTLYTIRKLKDSQNRYLWEPGLPNGNPPTIGGVEYTEMPDMPDIASNALPIAFGDYKRAYYIVDRTTIAVQRLEEVYATTAQIGLLAFRRVGGQVVLAEAVRVLKMA